MSVYFAQRRKRGLIKIGWSRSVTGRLRAMKAKILGAVPGDRSTEKGLHKRFDHLRVRGEWFKPGDDLLTFIQSRAQEHKPDAEVFQTAFRVPNLLLDRVDKIAKQMSRPGVRVRRSDVLRMALYQGVKQIEADETIFESLGKKR